MKEIVPVRVRGVWDVDDGYMELEMFNKYNEKGDVRETNGTETLFDTEECIE